MQKNIPTLPGASFQIDRLDERENPFTLIQHVWTTSLHLFVAEPSAVLVLSGQLTCERSGRSYRAGEAFAPTAGSNLSGDDVRFWQVTGQPELIRSLERFAAQLTRKDSALAAHAARVAQLAGDMGCYLGLGRARLERLSLAAYLHDLGKLTLPTTLLQTPERLGPSEWTLMKGHPSAGKRLLETTPLAFLGLMLEQHHERFDGSGYPFGLQNDEVSPESYIIAVADTFDAITNDRPYRRAQKREWAFAEIDRYSGVLFPHEVVAALSAVTNDVMAEALTAQVVR